MCIVEIVAFEMWETLSRAGEGGGGGGECVYTPGNLYSKCYGILGD